MGFPRGEKGRDLSYTNKPHVRKPSETGAPGGPRIDVCNFTSGTNIEVKYSKDNTDRLRVVLQVLLEIFSVPGNLDVTAMLVAMHTIADATMFGETNMWCRQGRVEMRASPKAVLSRVFRAAYLGTSDASDQLNYAQVRRKDLP